MQRFPICKILFLKLAVNPRLRSAGDPVPGFLWSTVIRNREHRTLIGLFLAEAILILKSFLKYHFQQ